VIIECTSCHAKYQYDENRLAGKQTKKIRCGRCQSVFEVQNPFYAAPAPSSDPSVETDPTIMKRRPRTIEESIDFPLPDELPGAGKDRAALQLPRGLRLSLAVIDGPDVGNLFRIEQPRVTIGRSGADLTLNDTETSRNHAAVEIHDTIYLLSDLGSTNGTLIGGEKVTEPIEIQNQTEFVVGNTTLLFIVAQE
jgi:predicted Zn finger-like uncharacterized protein